MTRVLLIEDDGMVADLVTMVLADAGYDVERLPVERATQGYLREAAPALILLDLPHSEAQGRAILWRCKQDPRLAHIPILAMSGTAFSMGDHDQPGPDGVIRKPFDIDELTELVSRLVDGATPGEMDGTS